MTNQNWKIVYYKTLQGNLPAAEFINSLEAKAKDKIINTFDLLTEFGIKLGPPHCKKLSGTQVWELR
ncbi:type II toxin-antitoxin system RelE/ParE family toxin, partial [Candidatus Microgenomates bacterium]|nr:type II toxin-antitoxin system RelE/ParE family toxin [Candidatus Microgenomates bacterium]